MSHHAVRTDSRYSTFLERLYLGYMGALPSLATFVTLWRYGSEPRIMLMVILFGGVVAVNVYLVIMITYTAMPKRHALGLLALLDTPLISSASVATTTGGIAGRTPFAFVIENFLIDAVTICGAMLILGLYASRPHWDRALAIVLVVFAWVGMATLVWPYIAAEVLGNWGKIFWLIVGAGEALVANYYLLKRDVTVRDFDSHAQSFGYFLLLWVLSIIAGMVAHTGGIGADPTP